MNPHAVRLADGIRLGLPNLEWHGGLVLSLAEFLLVSAAHQRAFDVDVITLAPYQRPTRRGRSTRRFDATPSWSTSSVADVPRHHGSRLRPVLP